MRILGVDPGIAITGYGIVEFNGNKFYPVTYGCFRSAADKPLYLRLYQLFNELDGLIVKYQPQCLAVEELFFNRNVRTAMVVGQARGIVLLAAARAGIEVYEYTPLQVKQAVAGHGRAEKKQIQYMVRVILNLAEIPRPDDVADALAVAVCHGNNCSGLGALL
ncbi:crossover junction endodeoxyribonuclease RuvC [Desulfallas sp. Bu1-1]|jgi:crossover junction endodeoxyribonuclease RuvC|uniref:crossover junction endodeoxyribonuclease RuvC n=1 Tax=Desulfallas sp. Bu1-1 TaxID=2787620 RepID=UPI00189FA1FA|nr:crossover junction endodeoxyribonuclease RuvC [Desulfallas sp. Bu1-1]MBF7083515.1 crossover junction endodeoxyribonuclease RuvC [Desulfallas sp. Bu1-1]